MIQFTRSDFEEADEKLNKLYNEQYELTCRLRNLEIELQIAEGERNFIGDWLKRNGVSKEDAEKIENSIDPIEF